MAEEGGGALGGKARQTKTTRQSVRWEALGGEEEEEEKKRDV